MFALAPSFHRSGSDKMKTINDGTPGADGHARIEAALANYPDIDAEILAELIHWFHNEASALDVGLIASDPRLNKPYQQFKDDHLNRFSGIDLFWAAIFVMVAGGAILLMIWSAN